MKAIFLLSEVVIMWDSICIQLVICLAAALILSVVLGVRSYVKYEQCVKAYNAGNWGYILKQKSTLIHISRAKSLYDGCMYMLAVANFEQNDDDEFLIYLDKLNSVKYAGRKLYLEANYLITKSETATQQIDESLHNLSSFEDEDSQKCFKISTLLYQIKYKQHICSTEELEALKEIKSDRIKKAFSL